MQTQFLSLFLIWLRWAFVTACGISTLHVNSYLQHIGIEFPKD